MTEDTMSLFAGNLMEGFLQAHRQNVPITPIMAILSTDTAGNPDAGHQLVRDIIFFADAHHFKKLSADIPLFLAQFAEQHSSNTPINHVAFIFETTSSTYGGTKEHDAITVLFYDYVRQQPLGLAHSLFVNYGTPQAFLDEVMFSREFSHVDPLLKEKRILH